MDPPQPGPAVEQACAALGAELPDRLDGQERRATAPESDLTAAWGEPAITLRCGVARPAELTPTSDLVTVDGVDWLPIRLTNGYRFVATGRPAYVQVDVPADHAPEINAVVDLAGPIARALPVNAGPAASPTRS